MTNETKYLDLGAKFINREFISENVAKISSMKPFFKVRQIDRLVNKTINEIEVLVF